MRANGADALSRGYEGFGGKVSTFVSDSEPWWREHPTAREDSPNLIIMLIDDLGFSDLGPFESEIDTPHIDGLADNAGASQITELRLCVRRHVPHYCPG